MLNTKDYNVLRSHQLSTCACPECSTWRQELLDRLHAKSVALEEAHRRAATSTLRFQEASAAILNAVHDNRHEMYHE